MGVPDRLTIRDYPRIRVSSDPKPPRNMARPIGSFILGAMLKGSVDFDATRTAEMSRILMIPV